MNFEYMIAALLPTGLSERIFTYRCTNESEIKKAERNQKRPITLQVGLGSSLKVVACSLTPPE